MKRFPEAPQGRILRGIPDSSGDRDRRHEERPRWSRKKGVERGQPFLLAPREVAPDALSCPSPSPRMGGEGDLASCHPQQPSQNCFERGDWARTESPPAREPRRGILEIPPLERHASSRNRVSRYLCLSKA